MKEETHGGSPAGSETWRRNQRPRRGLVSEHEGALQQVAYRPRSLTTALTDRKVHYAQK